MPPSATQSSNRRSAGSMRQRENRVHTQQQQPVSSSTRRRKSRSPDARVEDTALAQNDALHSRRKKLPPIPTSSSAPKTPLSRSSWHDDAMGERGRTKPKSKPRAVTMWVDEDVGGASIVTNIVQDPTRSGNGQSSRSKRKDRSRSREAPQRVARKTATPELMGDEDEPMYTGPLAHAEYLRMKLELENLHKQMAAAKKTIVKQSKIIDELRSELTSTNESHRTQRAEMEKLKSHSKKSTDLIATIETNLTCQICMEIMLKPYGLSPCGHVLCMTCLLGWFKSAPPGEDEMLDDDYPDALLYRKKTCPCCRTAVRARPIPLYLVKSLSSALDKSKAPAGTSRPSPPPDDEDPWAGIFRDPHDAADYWSTDDDEEDEDEDEDGDDGGYDDEEDYWSIDGYGSGDDDDHYEGRYVNPRWAPPTVYVDERDYTFLEEDAPEWTLLRRGATLAMIEIFHMTYEHDNGICAIIDEDNVVYLGWNIDLQPDDGTGEAYMDWVVQDMYDRPERWRLVTDDEEGTWCAWKLVPEEDAEEFDDSDSEMWAQEGADDVDDY